MKCVLGGVWDVREQHVMPTAVLSLFLCLSLKTSSSLAVQRTAGCCTSTSVANPALPCSVLCRVLCSSHN